MDEGDTIDKSPLEGQVLKSIAGLVFDLSGIVLDETKSAMIASRISKSTRLRKNEEIDAYVKFLRCHGSNGDLDQFISAFTTNMTRFSREQHHFDFLRSDGASHFMKIARAGRDIRVWSAGCSTGEEAFDIAFRLRDALQADMSNPDAFNILATDIDNNVLATAKQAVYPASSVSEVDAGYLERYFYPPIAGSSDRKVSEIISNRISFRRLNLHGPWPMMEKFDLIMCRNVAIYFESEASERLWRRFSDFLELGGFLIVGHSENPTGCALSNLVQISPGVFRNGRVSEHVDRHDIEQEVS